MPEQFPDSKNSSPLISKKEGVKEQEEKSAMEKVRSFEGKIVYTIGVDGLPQECEIAGCFFDKKRDIEMVHLEWKKKLPDGTEWPCFDRIPLAVFLEMIFGRIVVEMGYFGLGSPFEPINPDTNKFIILILYVLF